MEKLVKGVNMFTLNRSIREKSLELWMKKAERQVCVQLMEPNIQQGDKLLVEVVAGSIKEALVRLEQILEQQTKSWDVPYHDQINTDGTTTSTNAVEELLKKNGGILKIQNSQNGFSVFLQVKGKKEHIPIYPYRTLEQTIEAIYQVIALRERS